MSFCQADTVKNKNIAADNWQEKLQKESRIILA